MAYIPRSIAIYKGYSGNKWWLYGFLIFPIALIHSLCKGKSEARMILDGTHKKCPYCAEIIKKEAKVCHYCGRDVGENLRPSLPDAHFTDKIKELSNENKERWRDGETRSCPVCGGVFSADRMQCPFCHADTRVLENYYIDRNRDTTIQQKAMSALEGAFSPSNVIRGNFGRRIVKPSATSLKNRPHMVFGNQGIFVDADLVR